MNTTEGIIAAVLQAEGGYADRAADRGGPTNLGITLPTLSAYLGRPATVDELRALTPETATAIYVELFVRRPGFDRIADPTLRALVVDCGVQHSPERATQWLQRAAGLSTADGVFGPVTQTAVAGLAPRLLRARILSIRVRFYGAIVSHDPSQAANAFGWANRISPFIEGLA